MWLICLRWSRLQWLLLWVQWYVRLTAAILAVVHPSQINLKPASAEQGGVYLLPQALLLTRKTIQQVAEQGRAADGGQASRNAKVWNSAGCSIPVKVHPGVVTNPHCGAQLVPQLPAVHTLQQHAAKRCLL